MEQLDEIKEEIKKTKGETLNAYDLAIKTIEQNYKREKFMIKCLLAIILILLMINGYFAYVFTTTSVVETTTEQEGIYNFCDSEDNMVSSDLSLDEMKELIEINGED